jgi:hypothetical protein
MNMPMNKVFGLEDPHKPQKDLKPPMTFIRFIVNALGRRMGEENVHKTPSEDPVKKEAGEELEYFQGHPPFGVLIFPVVIEHRSSKAGDDEPFLETHPGTDVDCPCSRRNTGKNRELPDFFRIRAVFYIPVILKVMVSEDKEHGLIQARHDKFQIFQRQIPGAEYHGDIPKPFLDGIGIYQGIDMVRYTEYFHGFRPEHGVD